jgi:hypothetical protein
MAGLRRSQYFWSRSAEHAADTLLVNVKSGFCVKDEAGRILQEGQMARKRRSDTAASPAGPRAI